MKIVNDPFYYILKTFEKRHPNKTKVVMLFTDELKDDDDQNVYGVTLFPDKETVLDVPHIYIVYTLSVADAAEVLCHELAHLAVGFEADHNEVWEAEFEALVDESQEMAKEAFMSPPFSDVGEVRRSE